MTAADQARFRRQCESLAEAEHDGLGTPEARRAFAAGINRVLARAGHEAWLTEVDDHDDEDPPELGFQRRVRSLGMARSRR
jgi:hypothetical protein